LPPAPTIAPDEVSAARSFLSEAREQSHDPRKRRGLSGKIQENQRKTIGKTYENHEKIMGNMGTYTIQMGGDWENQIFDYQRV
jgi:hypothetical protein